MVLVKKLTCSWRWVKIPAVSLNLRNELLNHTPSGQFLFSRNHQTKSYTVVDPKPEEEPKAIWKGWEDQRAALGSGCFPLALWNRAVGFDSVSLWFSYLQRSLFPEKSEIPEFIPSLPWFWLHPPDKVCGTLGSLLQCCSLLMLEYVDVYVLSTLSLQLWRVSA